jgi:diadenosine tetraphosphate (Ap4A) HIT family hydrolase
MKEFSHNIIKEYDYWTVLAHSNQGYLGRSVVWCNRESAEDLTEATEEERQELFLILVDLKKALEQAFKPDVLNYAFLGNETKHLHCHVVPRYKEPREFAGQKFEDKKWGHNFETDWSITTTQDTVDQVKLRILEFLKKD